MLKNSTNILILNLSLADLAVSSVLNSFVVVGVLAGESFFKLRPILCQFVAGWCVTTCEASIANIGLLALNRYINICHHRYYQKLFSTHKTIIYCLVTWIYGFMIDLPTFVGMQFIYKLWIGFNFFRNVTLGWSGNYFDPKTLNCIFDRTKSRSFMIYFFVVSIAVPCTMVFGFYVRIFCHVRATSKRVQNASKCKNSDSEKSIRIAKGLFGSFALFALCW